MALGPDVARGPIIAAAFLFTVDQFQRAIFHYGILAPTTAQDVRARRML